jgi:hypothetical protein
MGHHKLFYQDAKTIRDQLNTAIDLSQNILLQEQKLIQLLVEIDRNKFYVRYGFKSLMGFCKSGLRLSKTQSQRIATQVRRQQNSDSDGSFAHEFRSEL